MAKLEGRVALVTGSGRGVGRALALKLAGEGAAVVVNDLDEAPAMAVVAEINHGGGRATACVGSVTDVDFPTRFMATAIETYGDIHIIVNNAGYTWDSVIQKMTDEQFDAMYEVHVKAPFRILREAAEIIRIKSKEEAMNGREIFRKVVNISSIAGFGGNAGQVNYSSAKAALIGMSKTLAKEWGRYKVNVNCVGFGYIETRLTEAVDEKKMVDVGGREVAMGIPKEGVEFFTSQIPLGRAGTPEDAANGVYLFCTPESDYITGQVVTVGGGLIA
jgi:3-oxoacyl-[acyl-carrier protein] reductase